MIGLAAILSPAQALAQEESDMAGPALKDPIRSGWTAAMAIGPGELHIIPDDGDAQRSEGPGFSLRVGKALSQDQLLYVFSEFVDSGGASSFLNGVALQAYFRESWYARGGAGLGVVDFGGEEGMGSDTEVGAGGTLALGKEWLQLQDLGLNTELVAMANRLFDVDATIINASLLLGIVWY